MTASHSGAWSRRFSDPNSPLLYVPASAHLLEQVREKNALPPGLRIFNDVALARAHAQALAGGVDWRLLVYPRRVIDEGDLAPDTPVPLPATYRLNDNAHEDVRRRVRADRLIAAQWASSDQTVSTSLRLLHSAVTAVALPVSGAGELAPTQASTKPFFDPRLLGSHTDQAGVFYAALAQQDALPIGFREWQLKDEKGCPVAHAAARLGVLPSDFTGWFLVGPDGRTVLDICCEQGNRELLAQYERQHMLSLYEAPADEYTSGVSITRRKEF